LTIGATEAAMAHTIGKRIREIRTQRGLKQAELAALIDVSPTYLNLIEHDKRAVSGKLSSRIAQALETDRNHLTRGTTAAVIEQLQQSARQVPTTSNKPIAELDEIELFTTRFPGWAGVLLHQSEMRKHLESLLETLSDRLSHDTILADNIHIMLSNITAIRAISELLVMRGSMEETKQKSFIQNIFLESKRLSTAAEKLLEQFDPTTASLSDYVNPHLPKAKSGAAHNQKNVSQSQRSQSQMPLTEKLKLPEALLKNELFQQVQSTVTRQALHNSHSAHHNQPFLIADEFNLPAQLIFYQLLCLSGQDGLPDYGLLEVDNSAGVLYRHEIDTMRLPLRSGACPRWPVYRALGITGEPVLQRIQFTTGDTYQAYAISQARKREHSQLAPVSQSVMLFHKTNPNESAPFAPPVVDVGFHCSVCNRTSCSDRREVYALFAD